LNKKKKLFRFSCRSHGRRWFDSRNMR